MANAQLLMYGSKHLEQNFFFFVFLKKCEYPMVLSDLEIPPDLKIELPRTCHNRKMVFDRVVHNADAQKLNRGRYN